MAKSPRPRHEPRLVNPYSVDDQRRRAPGGAAAAAAVLAGAAGLVVLGAGTASAAPVLDDDATGTGSSSGFDALPDLGSGSSDVFTSAGGVDLDAASFSDPSDQPSFELAPDLADPLPLPEPEPVSIPEPDPVSEPVTQFEFEPEPSDAVVRLPEPAPVLLADASLSSQSPRNSGGGSGVDGVPVAVPPVVEDGLTFGATDLKTTAAFDALLTTARGTTTPQDASAWQFGADAVSAFDPATGAIGFADPETTAALDVLLGNAAGDPADASRTSGGVAGSDRPLALDFADPATQALLDELGIAPTPSVGTTRSGTGGTRVTTSTPGGASGARTNPFGSISGSSSTAPPGSMSGGSSSGDLTTTGSLAGIDADADFTDPTAGSQEANGRGAGTVAGATATTNPVPDFLRFDPDFDLFDPKAWTPTPATGVYTVLGTGASGMVNTAALQAQARAAGQTLPFSTAFRNQLPGQPLNIFRDLALLGVNNQTILEDPVADAIAKGTIGSVFGVGSQELARRVLNPAVKDAVTNRQVNRFTNYLETGDERLLRGLNFTDPNIRLDAPLNNPTIAGINFAVPFANLAVDSALRAAGRSDIPGLSGIDKNYWANLAGDSAAMCAGVGVPISVALRRPIWPACYYPAGQSAAATLLTRPPQGIDLGPVGTALRETCSDDNPAVDLLEQVVCTLGEKPSPPATPPGAPPVVDPSMFGSGATPSPALAGAVPTRRDVPTVPVGAFVTGEVNPSTVSPGLRTTTPSIGTSSVPAASPVLTCDSGAWVRCPGSPGHPAGQPRVGRGIVGRATVGPAKVGPRIVGPATVGPAKVGPRIVGPATVGPAKVGPAKVGPRIVGPAIVGEPETGLVQRSINAVGDAYQRLDAAGRESLRTTISGSQPLDGTLGFGVTRHMVEFMDGGRGVYDPEGNLLRTEKGNPPQRVAGWQLFKPGGAPMIPGRAGPAGTPIMRGAPILIR